MMTARNRMLLCWASRRIQKHRPPRRLISSIRRSASSTKTSCDSSNFVNSIWRQLKAFAYRRSVTFRRQQCTFRGLFLAMHRLIRHLLTATILRMALSLIWITFRGWGDITNTRMPAANCPEYSCSLMYCELAAGVSCCDQLQNIALVQVKSAVQMQELQLQY